MLGRVRMIRSKVAWKINHTTSNRLLLYFSKLVAVAQPTRKRENKIIFSTQNQKQAGGSLSIIYTEKLPF